jgi:hypothetical protein
MLQLDAITSLAMSIQTNPGVYALLIGSGVSRAAAIPTGWDVTLDLIEKLAASRGEQTGGEPTKWFKAKFNADPNYSDLLEQIYDQGSRQAELRKYFEPTEDEREEGKKLPTVAHRAIARLVRDGYVRVILTPNFDHLTEDAIRAEGIRPVVISTADAIAGAPPLVHTNCVVVKVHGDYLDTRIKNTKQELTDYDPRMNRLLDNIVDDFGLIVCGWSAEWDPALRAVLERASNRRYATFWTALSDPTGVAEKLISVRSAKFIKISSADIFLDNLAEKVSAVAEASQPNPADIETAVATAKRYLPEDRHRIRLDDLLRTEARRTHDRLKELQASFTGGVFSFEKEVEKHEAASEKLLTLLVTCGFHSRNDDAKLMRDCIEIVAAELFPGQGNRGFPLMSLYTVGLAVYVTSLAASAGGNGKMAAEMMKVRGTLGVNRGRVLPLFAGIGLDGHTQRPPDQGPLFTPASEFLHARCKGRVSSLFSDLRDYDLAFDRFEYVQALVARDDKKGGVFFYGRWMWQAANAEMRDMVDVRKVIGDEIDQQGESWPHLQVGFFGGAITRLREVKNKLDADLQNPIERMLHGTF